jgi:hypothetical protein
MPGAGLENAGDDTLAVVLICGLEVLLRSAGVEGATGVPNVAMGGANGSFR